MSMKFSTLGSIAATALALAACGGGSDPVVTPATTSGAGATTPTATTPVTPVTPVTPITPVTPPVVTNSGDTTLTGSVVKGPVGNATVTVKKPDGTACGTTSTNVAGQYSFTTACIGDVIVEVTGGSYTDEATNTVKTLSTPLKTVISATGGTVNAVVTPLTTIAFSYAFTSSNAATKAAFDAQAAKIATQFGLTGVNLATNVPVVSGTTNAYGNALKGISQYLKDNPAQTLAAVTTASLKSSADFTNFGTLYSAAYNKANGTNITLNFDGAAFNFTGTGAGGGSGTCGISQKGTVTAANITVPISFDYCVSGIAGSSCDAGNSALNQSLSAQSGVISGANIVTTYSATCVPGAIAIVLK